MNHFLHRALLRLVLVASLLFLAGPCAERRIFSQPGVQAGAVQATKPQLAATGLDSAFQVKHYDINLRIDPSAKSISGSVTMHAIAGASKLNAITLDLGDLMVVSSVSSEDRAQTFTHKDNLLHITFAHAYRSGASFAVTVNYKGTPAGRAFVFGEHQSIPMIYTYGMPNAARRWWPCKDTPAEKAASVDLAITVPEKVEVPTNSADKHDTVVPLIVASNGKLVKETSNSDGTRTFYWQVRYPIYPDVVSLAITNYSTFTLPYQYSSTATMPMTFYVFPEDLQKAKVDFSALPGIMKHHASVFGEYPYLKEKYGIAEFALQSFREHQTLPSYGAALITGDHKNDETLAHELAHQWFGNLISVKSWSHIWLNEGFANYAYALWQESVGGKKAYLATMKSWDDSPLEGPIFIQDANDNSKLFSSNTFNKGAWVLHMLRHVMGDEKFFRALRTYVKTYAFKSADTEDFQAVCEKAYGRPLVWFFKEWIYGRGRPQFKYEWNVTARRGRRIVKVTVDQAQTNAGLFEMPVDVVITTVSRDKHLGSEVWIENHQTFVAPVKLKSQVFEFIVNDDVTQVRLDPDRWVLRQETEKPKH